MNQYYIGGYMANITLESLQREVKLLRADLRKERQLRKLLGWVFCRNADSGTITNAIVTECQVSLGLPIDTSVDNLSRLFLLFSAVIGSIPSESALPTLHDLLDWSSDRPTHHVYVGPAYPVGLLSK
jgi:hypothetical protein